MFAISAIGVDLRTAYDTCKDQEQLHRNTQVAIRSGWAAVMGKQPVPATCSCSLQLLESRAMPNTSLGVKAR
jgi:hypothetical protein